MGRLPSELTDWHTTGVSVASDGTQSAGDSFPLSNPSISAHGLYVAFDSVAGDLVGDDRNEEFDVFLYQNSDSVPLFADVTLEHGFYSDRTIEEAGFTAGCSIQPPRYRPMMW